MIELKNIGYHVVNLNWKIYVSREALNFFMNWKEMKELDSVERIKLWTWEWKKLVLYNLDDIVEYKERKSLLNALDVFKRIFKAIKRTDIIKCS